jgi:hypothetical protein
MLQIVFLSSQAFEKILEQLIMILELIQKIGTISPIPINRMSTNYLPLPKEGKW